MTRWLPVFAIVGIVAVGCSRNTTPDPRPQVFDDPMGPIARAEETQSQGLDAPASTQPVVSYIANGFVHLATPEDRRAGRSELRFYNPFNKSVEVTLEVLFDNRPPEIYSTFTMRPNNNDVLISIPYDRPGFFDGSEAWGARITSSAPVLALNMLSAGVVAPGGDLWFGDPRYKGANTASHATSRLSKRWYFEDGIVLRWDEQKPGQLFNEYEWYHVLNPNEADLEIRMHCNYINGTSEIFTFTVKGNRVRIIDNKDLVRPNLPHSVVFEGDRPFLVSAERFIYDFNDTEEWGAWLHANHDGVPLEDIAP